MVLNYFKLSEESFGVTPDSRFLFLGRQDREAMASFAYGTEGNRGFLAQIVMPSTPRAPAHDRKPVFSMFSSFTHEVGKE
jgi:hypothetical protein